MLVGTAAVIVPPGRDGVDMERAEDGLLDGVRDGPHIILDSVKPTEVKYDPTLETLPKHVKACLIESLCSRIFDTKEHRR